MRKKGDAKKREHKQAATMLRVRSGTCNALRRIAQTLPTTARTISSSGSSSSSLISASALPSGKPQLFSGHKIAVPSAAATRSLATGPAASPTVVSDELLAKLGSLSTQVCLFLSYTVSS